MKNNIVCKNYYFNNLSNIDSEDEVIEFIANIMDNVEISLSTEVDDCGNKEEIIESNYIKLHVDISNLDQDHINFMKLFCGKLCYSKVFGNIDNNDAIEAYVYSETELRLRKVYGFCWKNGKLNKDFKFNEKMILKLYFSNFKD